MSDIVTTRIFQDGEKNITAAKLNDIVASSTIQPAFVSSKPSTSTIATTDNLLVLQTAGTYAKAPFQTVIDSVSAGINSDTEIWNVRLRSFNAIGNPTFEVDQRNAGGLTSNIASNAFIQDRWYVVKGGTMAASAGQGPGNILLPGTNFTITRSYMRITLTTAQASLAAADNLQITQTIEGPQWRELQSDVHSLQALVRSSVAGLKFGLVVRDVTTTKSLVNLCTIPSTNVWTLITLPNLPVWPSGNFVNTPGSAGYQVNFCLAAGTTYVTPANGTWQNGLFIGAVGQDNFAGKPVNSTFDIAFVQHEPGPVCTTPIDCPFEDNYRSCLRYFQKSYPYLQAIGFNNSAGYSTAFSFTAVSNATFGMYVNQRFTGHLAKYPTGTVYHPNTGAANSLLLFYATSGTIPTTTSSQPVTAVNMSPSAFYNLTCATGTSSAPMTALLEWTADTGW